jgi:hypothetical protein
MVATGVEGETRTPPPPTTQARGAAEAGILLLAMVEGPARAIELTMPAREAEATIRGEVCPHSSVLSLVCVLHIALSWPRHGADEGVQTGLLAATVAASASSFPTASQSDGRRGSLDGLAERDMAEGFLAEVLDTAERVIVRDRAKEVRSG